MQRLTVIDILVMILFNGQNDSNMGKLIKMIKSHCSKIILNEDGDNLTIELADAVVIEDISKFEIVNDIEVPEDLKELLLFSNGVNLFGLQILSLEEMEFFPNTGILSFHNWGNGDFDCLSIGGDYPKEAVVFMSHNEDNTVLVSDNLVEWFKRVISEIKELGTLLHPLDYSERKLEGLYKNISHQIS